LTRSSENKTLEIIEALPVTKLATPIGRSVFINSSNKAIAILGVSLAGFVIIVQPAASAGATLRAIIAPGKFHGVMRPHTPIGCLITDMRWLLFDGGMISP